MQDNFTTENQKPFKDFSKIKTKKKPQSCRLNTEDQLKEQFKEDQILYQKLPKYYQICHDNMSKNVLVYIDQNKIKNNFQLQQNPVSEEIKELDRKILKLQKQLLQQNQQQDDENEGFITQPKPKIQKKELIKQQQAKTFYKSNTIQQGIDELQEFIRKKKMMQITSDSNTLQKYGKPKDKLDHLKRVITKENTPIVPLLACNSFKPKKPAQMNQIEAYLNDYKPFVTGQVGIVPRKLQEINLLKPKDDQANKEPYRKNLDLVIKNTTFQ